MVDKRALILPADLVEKIDAHRGDVGRVDFITFLLDHLLQDSQEKGAPSHFVTRPELESFERDMRALLRSFLEFFITYGLELGASTKSEEFTTLEQKLRSVMGGPAKGPKELDN